MSRKQLALLEPTLVRQALLDAVKKLSPMVQWRNPVMFIVWVGSLLTTLLAIAMAGGALTGSATFTAAVSIWLWFTVLFANFAEAMAEGRSKAQANSLKGVKKTAFARKLRAPQHDATVDHVPAEDLRKGDVVLVEAGDIIPCDGEVIEGGASVDESAITGESAPVIRESGVNSLRVGDVYYVGHLPWFERIWFALSNHPILLAIFAAVSIVLLAWVLWRMLRIISRRRLSLDDE